MSDNSSNRGGDHQHWQPHIQPEPIPTKTNNRFHFHPCHRAVTHNPSTQALIRQLAASPSRYHQDLLNPRSRRTIHQFPLDRCRRITIHTPSLTHSLHVTFQSTRTHNQPRRFNSLACYRQDSSTLDRRHRWALDPRWTLSHGHSDIRQRRPRVLYSRCIRTLRTSLSLYRLLHRKLDQCSLVGMCHRTFILIRLKRSLLSRDLLGGSRWRRNFQVMQVLSGARSRWQTETR